MITLPAKFEACNNKNGTRPSVIVGVSSDVVENEQTTYGDWSNNSAETTVDYDTDPGFVILQSDTIPDESQTAQDGLLVLDVNFPGVTVFLNGYILQEFKQTTGATKTLNTVTIRAAYGAAYTITNYPKLYMEIFEGGVSVSPKLAKSITTIPSTIISTSGENYTYDFSPYNIKIKNNTTYTIRLTGILGQAFSLLVYYKTGSASYADGDMEAYTSVGTITDGDLRFTVDFTGDYYVLTGSITTQIIDLGEVPIIDGEVQIQDLLGDQTLTYTLYGSTDNFVASDVTIGTITDGYVLTGAEIYRYYKVKADFLSDDKNETPILQSIKIIFIEYYKFSDNKTLLLGYDPSLKKISSLTNEISDTGTPTIGQITLTFGRTEVMSNFIYSAYPKNRRIYIKIGFIDDGFTEDDYIDFYNGVIDDYALIEQDITVKIKDPNQNWKTTVPKNETAAGNHASGTFTNIVATADHPIDVIVDILQNYLEFRDSLIDFGSFEIAKASLPSWEVTRTITGTDRESGQALINELRFLIGAYFIPDPSGKIKIKLYDPDEATVGSIGLNDYMNEPTWDGNATEIKNQTYIEYDWDTGTETYDQIYVGIDSASQANYRETFEFQYQDKWTVHDAQGDSQMSTLTNRILQRYADPPPKFKCRLDRRHFIYEVGDQLLITTEQAPSSDLSGVVDEKYEIIKKNFNPLSAYVDYTFLKVVETP